MEKDARKVMEELIEKLSEAAKAYYVDAKEIMTNYEYDALYDRLEALEKETGIILAGSPTQKVGYEVASELPKETHPSRMLSLDKTKSREELRDWLGEREGLLSWKLDGLTVVLTYEDGALTKAVTRGNGEEGEVITANAKTFVNLPVRISHKGSLVLRGEAVITYDEFERINEEISDADAPIFAIASTATLSCVDHISFALCSTHPACGKYCLNSFCARLQMRLCLSKSMHLQLVVPASRAIIYSAIDKWILLLFI